MRDRGVFKRESLLSAMDFWAKSAQMGDCRAMAFMSAIAYLLEGVDEPNDKVRNLLRRAMGSDNAEFLIELGEELVIGYPFFRDLRLAKECFRLALSMSEMKGSYALGRFAAPFDKSASANYFRRAGKLGHFPSEVMADVAFQKPTSHFMKAAKTLLFGLSQARRIEQALRSAEAHVRFWRFRDDLGHIVVLQSAIGVDREKVFPWSMPISLRSFMLLMKGGDSPLHASRRTGISAEQLMPTNS